VVWFERIAKLHRQRRGTFATSSQSPGRHHPLAKCLDPEVLAGVLGPAAAKPATTTALLGQTGIVI
jgi:hypothetical protein